MPAKLYHEGMNVRGLVLERSVGNGEWIVRCPCGCSFERSTSNLQTLEPLCRACRHRIRAARTNAARRAAMGKVERNPNAVCGKCFDLAHRVQGPKCTRCGLPHERQGPLRAQVIWGSSAGYAMRCG
jgi:ribosomal protein L37E